MFRFGECLGGLLGGDMSVTMVLVTKQGPCLTCRLGTSESQRFESQPLLLDWPCTEQRTDGAPAGVEARDTDGFGGRAVF